MSHRVRPIDRAFTFAGSRDVTDRLRKSTSRRHYALRSSLLQMVIPKGFDVSEYSTTNVNSQTRVYCSLASFVSTCVTLSTIPSAIRQRPRGSLFLSYLTRERLESNNARVFYEYASAPRRASRPVDQYRPSFSRGILTNESHRARPRQSARKEVSSTEVSCGGTDGGLLSHG